MTCICVHPGAYGCPICRPDRWIKTEYEKYIMWVQKKETIIDSYMYYI